MSSARTERRGGLRAAAVLGLWLAAPSVARGEAPVVAEAAAPTAVSAEARPSVSRAPAASELLRDVVVPDGVTGTERTSWERQRLAQLRSRTALRGLDAAVRWQLPHVGACAAREGLTGPQEGTLTLSFRADGSVARARATGGASVVGCLVSAYAVAALPVLTDRTQTLTWTVAFDAAPVPTPPSSAYLPVDPAGSLRLDEAAGFAGVAFGDTPDDHPDLSLQRTSGDLRFYQREADIGTRWMGVDVSGVSYVAAPEVGVFAVVVFVSDPNGAFRVRDGVRARYGVLRLDPVLDTSYVRGARNVVEVRAFGAGGVAVTLLDLARGAASNAYGRVPGDPVGAGSDGRRLPRIFADDAPAGAAPSSPTP
jgi:hypothetical protein